MRKERAVCRERGPDQQAPFPRRGRILQQKSGIGARPLPPLQASAEAALADNAAAACCCSCVWLLLKLPLLLPLKLPLPAPAANRSSLSDSRLREGQQDRGHGIGQQDRGHGIRSKPGGVLRFSLEKRGEPRHKLSQACEKCHPPTRPPNHLPTHLGRAEPLPNVEKNPLGAGAEGAVADRCSWCWCCWGG